MSVNWLRYCELLLEDSDKASLNLSELRVGFEINTHVQSTGSTGVISVYNLSKETRNAIMAGEYKKLRLVAGYQGVAAQQEQEPVVPDYMVGRVQENPQVKASGPNYGEIFSGEIRYAFAGSASEKPDQPSPDNVLKIQAIDGHQAAQEATLNTTVAAGYDTSAIHLLTLRSFNPYGVTAGATGKMPPTRFPRGKVLYQTASQAMDNVAAQCRATWQFVDGKLQMVPEDSYLDRITVLNSQTGLIGSPKLTQEGIEIKCLIDPNIRLHSLVQVDQAALNSRRNELESVNKAAAEAKASGGEAAKKAGAQKTEAPPADIAADGVYIVKGIRYEGDTRSSNWFMTLTCVVRDKQTALKTSGAQQ
ncbi:hypothetical protein [Kalamiella sp. sgz302252]|uniref:hypothetical protein n=1 Tax=Pantoea sp. sgz302252 TaxID=3341827 RepID=UPI0036D2B6A6